MMDLRKLRPCMASAWWVLPDKAFRVAITLAAMAEETDGAMVVTATSTSLAGRCMMNRMSLRRALDALTEAGFCVVESSEGYGGRMTITIVESDQSYSETNHVNGRALNEHLASESTSSDRPVVSDLVLDGQPQVTMCESLAALGDRGRENTQNSTSHKSDSAIQATDPSVFRARDLDLLRSPQKDQKDQRSDLRSSDLEILTRSYGPDGSDPVKTSEETSKPAKKTPRKRCDATRIPDRAWTAADYLRHMVLDRNGAAVVGMKPWKPGTAWVGGSSKGVKVEDGIGSREGLRLTWAEELRLFHQTLSGAFKRNNTPDHENAAWSAIASTIQWLFHKQPPGCRFVVESPGSLSRKWDRIKAVRESSTTTSPTSPLTNGRQSTLVRPKYEDKGPPTNMFETRRKT